MTKRRPCEQATVLPRQNPVAKFAHRFNKTQIFNDKRQYQRKAKHRGQEPFAIFSLETMAKGSTASRRVFQGLPTL